MWLIQFHVGFSILCLLCHVGIKIVFDEALKRYKKSGKKRARKYLLYFCPGINALLLLTLVYMAVCDDETADSINGRQEEAEK